MNINIKNGLFIGLLALVLLGAPAISEGVTVTVPPCVRGEVSECIQRNSATKECEVWACTTIAALSGRGGAATTTVDTTREVKTTLENIVGWIQVFFYIVATLMIILAAWSYLTAGGDETKVTGAKNKVIYALIAIAIAVIAGGVVTLVRNFVG